MIDLPEALDDLVTYLRSIDGEHPDRHEYQQAMLDQAKVLPSLVPDTWGPISREGFPVRLADT